MPVRKIAILFICLATLSWSSIAGAARLTDVFDAADGPNDPIDFGVTVDFTQEYEWSMITRERNTLSSIEKLMLNQNEFEYKSVKNILNINGRVGLYHDLEMHFTLPIHINETYNGSMSEHWRNKAWGGLYPPLTIAAQSRDQLIPGPSLLTDRVFGFYSWETVHEGFGDMTLGFSYSPLNETRDPKFPSWVLTIDMELPTGAEQKPKLAPAASSLLKGTGTGIAVGKKLFSFIFKTVISKRLGVADPYLGMHYKVPIATGDLIKDPRHEGGFLLGTEIVAFEKQRDFENEPLWKVAFDLRMDTTLYGKGQDFNEISNALAWRKDQNNTTSNTFWPTDPRSTKEPPRMFYYYPGGIAPEYELPTEERYAFIRGTFGIYAILHHYLLLSGNFSIGHRTEHFLSVATEVDSYTLRPADMSGYNTQINEVGTRIKKEQSLVIAYTFSIGFTY